MKKTLFVLAASALVASTPAVAQPAGTPRAQGNTVNMDGAPMAAPVTGAKVLMLRTMVSDLDRGVKFYQAVFGMTAVAMPGFGGPRPGAAPGAAPARPAGPGGPGGGIRILNFPGGSPGMIMIKGSGGPDMMRGSYVIQVPDIAAALAAAEANGGKVQPTRFTAGAAQSRHVLDPDGNDLEIMQSGPAPKPAAK
jgi:predicted enzyme related to lactoylglutathione lyase